MSVHQEIDRKLRDGLAGLRHLEVSNESGQHNVPPGSETHFKVVAVSDAFAGLGPVARHRAVYRLLADEMAGPVHALAVHAYTAEDWEARHGSAPGSPRCRGGSAA